MYYAIKEENNSKFPRPFNEDFFHGVIFNFLRWLFTVPYPW